MVSGLGPPSGQRVLIPFQTLPLARLAEMKCEGGPVSSGVSSEFPRTLYLIKFLAPSLIGHGWISGFTLAGCPGEGRLLPGEEGSHLQR